MSGGEQCQPSAPLLSLSNEERCALAETHPVCRAVGSYWLQPVRLDFEWILRVGPDPRPFADQDLARISHSIRTGGTVLVCASEQAALDIALAAIAAEGAIGNA